MSQARQGGMARDPWARGYFTPLPWNPSRATARLLKLSPQTTREWALRGKRCILCTHIWAYTLLPQSVSISTLSLPDTVIQPRSHLAQQAHTVYTELGSHITMATRKQTQPLFCVFTAAHPNINAVSASFTNICGTASLLLFEKYFRDCRRETVAILS